MSATKFKQQSSRAVLKDKIPSQPLEEQKYALAIHRKTTSEDQFEKYI
jgi:hypothetical protein